MYTRIKNSFGEKLSFSITVGFREGYGGGVVPAQDHSYDRFELITVLGKWMQKRASNNQPFLTGIVSEVQEVVYSHAAHFFSEPVVTFSGEVSHLYFPKDQINSVPDILDEIASVLGEAMNQTRVYVSYCDKNWIIQKE